MKTLNYYTDPGHGWLEVPRILLEELNIADSISPFSYQRGNMVYLEEDCDAGIFIKAFGQDIKLNEINSNHDSVIRDYDSFED